MPLFTSQLDTFPTALREWMSNSNTSNPLNNLSVVNARLATTLADSLNLQKSIVEELSTKIERISKSITTIKTIVFADQKPETIALLGTSKENSLAILEELQQLGVPNLEGYIAIVRAGTTPLSINNTWAGNITLQLQGFTDAASNKSQQESLRLQTFTNRYTQANDQASTVMQKDGQNKGTVINNLRGAG